jgi:LysR family glycine cleavage system transcriptional activator
MKSRKNLPIAALRAFEAAARLGQITLAANELAVTHGAVSRHVSALEDQLGTPLFEGARNRPKLTPEGRIFGSALTAAFDQIEDAVRLIGRSDSTILDVACLSTFAMRWLIPRLHDFTAKHPHYSVRLATDDRPSRAPVDVQILVLPPQGDLPAHCTLLFSEKLALIAAPGLVTGDPSNLYTQPRLVTRTRPDVWREWFQLLNTDSHEPQGATRMFDHYHLTIEAALNGLGVAIAPWHLIAENVAAGRLLTPCGVIESHYRYAVKASRPKQPKTANFVNWLLAASQKI